MMKSAQFKTSRSTLLAGLSILWIFTTLALSKGVEFNRPFAPQAGLVCRYEEPMRQEICLNGHWRFQGDPNTTVPGKTIPPLGEWDKTEIKIPSPWNVNGFFAGQPGGDFRAYPSYPKAWENLRAAWMEKTVTVPKEWEGKRIILHFGAVAGKMVVYVNGQWAGGGFDIFFPQEFDVTKLVRFGGANQILVKVIAPKVFDKPGRYGRREYLSGSFWGTFIAGIWQDVFLLAEPKVAVSDVFVQPWVDRNTLSVETTIANHGSTSATVSVSGNVREWINEAGKSVLEAPEVKWKLAEKSSLKLADQEITLSPGESRTITLTAKVDGHLKLWSPDAPNLYGLLLTVSVDGKPVDVKYQRFGWRQFTFEGNQLLLNGRPITLRGDSWHFLGVPQMTRRYAYAWYRLLKDAGANAVRLHASIYPSFYHDMADEMGIMILDESAIWASDGGLKVDSDLFWRNCQTNITELVRRDRNHPSVFGWSVCNEILPVMRNVWHAPQSMVDHCLDQISIWKDICRTNDPTRPWISGDGEWDADGRLPVISIHYGGDADMRRAADSGKPWEVGETSMAYYGTPRQVSQFNGNQAYESDLGRMKGLAYECYGLLRGQQKYGADYQSVFNIAWYSVQPLPLGKHDLTTPVSPNDGIFFGPYKEGVPGMQPERLGPYTSTLNPGYDPALPLYRPWPMFDAIRDANMGITNCPWAHRPDLTPPPVAPIPPATATASYVPENGNRLAQELERSGVQLSPYTNGVKTDFLLVDGSVAEAPDAAASLKSAVDNVLSQGGTVWIWNVTPTGAPAVSQLLGQDVSVEPREASSFVVKQNAPLLSGLDNAKLYFSESDDWRQMAYSLDGAFVKNAQVVLDACPADWRQWNYKPEPVKTAALYRSEVERTTPLTAIAIGPLDKGRVILCNLNPQIRSTKKSEVVARLFQNEGIPLEQISAQSNYLDPDGRLVRALVCGSFGMADSHDGYTAKPPAGKIKEGAALNNRHWRARAANGEGVFDFNHGLVKGPRQNAYAYLAVWIKSPKPLNDLLSEPNLPKLSFTYGSDDGCQVWLNGELLASHERIGPLEPEAFNINPLLLKLGWNELVIKVVQAGGEWKFEGKFGCSDANFLPKLEFSSDKPASE
jgi:Glycosyl hydrolases family 2, sugar binding domain/Glycosyl hydrolases family 2/Glycosyl hydrolases family 2, TIM barrel domain